MKRVVFYFLVLLFAVWLGVVMHRNPGYVLIAYHNTSIETSLWFAVVVLIFLFLFFHTLLRFSAGVCAVTSYIRQWIINRRKRRAHTQTVLGLYDFVEGNWVSSEKKLARSAKHSDMPLVNYLAAAFTAQRQHAFKRSDSYLRLAQKTAKDRPVAVGLAQARAQIDNQHWEEAGVILQQLYKIQPKNVFVLQLLVQVYSELKDWRSLEQLLPVLCKRRVFSFNEIDQLERKIYSELLLIGSKNHSIANTWDSMSGHLQKKPELVAIYADYLLVNNKADDAEAVLKIALRKILDDRLLELYARLQSSQPIKQLMRAEDWLKDNPENASLLLCLGRICRQQKLWGKTRHYLERSARLTPALAVYVELAKIMEEQNDLRGALDFYTKGMRLAKIGLYQN